MKRALALYALIFVLGSLRLSAQINTDHMMLVGRNALYFKDYVLSIQYFNQIINAKPYRYDAYFYRGLAKFYLDDFVGAERDCSEAIERNPFVVDCYQVRGMTRMRLGEFDDAIADYRKALSFDPESEGLWHNLALCYGHTECFDEAIGALDTLHSLSPSYTPALNMMAQLHIQQKDTTAALRDIRESISINKYDPDVYSMRAIVYMQQERYADAEEDLTYAIHLMPSSNDYVNRALTRYYQENLRGAMSDYDLALEIDPNNFLGHFNRGLLRAQVGDDNRAIEDFDFVIDQEPDNTIAVFNRALLRQQTGDYEGAEDDFSTVLDVYPDFLYGHECRADVRQHLGKRKLAEEDRLVVLKAQLDAFSGNNQSTHKDTTDDEQNTGARNRSDKNVKKYKRMVVADDQLALEGNEYTTEYRGKVQNRNIHVELLPLYVLTYYERNNKLTKTIHYHHDLDNLSGEGRLPLPLVITAMEKALDEEQIEFHFNDINVQTAGVASSSSDDDTASAFSEITAIHWLARGLDFYLVQDLISAIADYTSAIAADGSLWAASFNRGVARFKQAQIDAGMEDDLTAPVGPDNQISAYQLCLADFSKVIDLAPDFPQAYYNRGNVYAQIHDYEAALTDYSEAVRLDPAFAEAYYNRGLTYLFTGQNELGVADLSRAGELGIYTAYNLIKRFSN